MTFFRFWVLKKAEYPTSLTDFGRVIAVSDVQELNAWNSIVRTFWPIVTDESFLQPLNELPEIIWVSLEMS